MLRRRSHRSYRVAAALLLSAATLLLTSIAGVSPGDAGAAADAGRPTLIGAAAVNAAQSTGINAYVIDGGRLLGFNTATPGTILSDVPITGLIGGDVIVGIDFRPATGQLYGLGSVGGRLYTITPTTGAAT